MSEVTIDDLRQLLRTAAGESEADLDGDILDVEFGSLGYDSLALLETASLIERHHGVKVADDISAVRTPREFLDRVNQPVADAS
ncbi:acyl carrier protein [Streptomyces sp. NPDC048106]|uniref:acyl carrier protein n=1 Tax=Streptomyces sp. NPDC048106 TaxID=3155750 RepID=UPI0034549896